MAADFAMIAAYCGDWPGEELAGPDEASAAREWASWIRQHAERINPLNGPSQVIEVIFCGHQELQPYVSG